MIDDVRDVGPDKGIMGRIRRCRRKGLRRDGGEDEGHQERMERTAQHPDFN